jgi:thiamine pyrophosphate-dependent acetolactate synthase large subunit-like protein
MGIDIREGMNAPAAPTSSQAESGAVALVRFLERLGRPVVFGLPGSTMVSVMHAMQDSALVFVPALHESAAIAMADGYARVAGPTAALVYMLPGTMNGLTNVYNAWRDETPLLVIASQQGSQHRGVQASVGEGDPAALIAPFTRFAWEVRHPDQLLPILEVALRRAMGPPAGPSFVAVPEDILTGPTTGTAQALAPSTRVPGLPDVTPVIERLASASRPVAVVGGQVRRYGGVEALEQVADVLELPVLLEPMWNDRLGLSPAHRCWLGPFTHRSTLVRESDVVLAVGCRLFNEVHPHHRPWFAPDAFVAHVNADTAKIDEGTRANWSYAGDPGWFLSALLEAATSSRPPAGTLTTDRRERLAAARARRRQRRDTALDQAAGALATALDAAWIIDESVSGNFALTSALRSQRGDHFISTTGGALGWGIGAATGVALATGDHVVCVLGDGAFFFGVQGLWQARVSDLPITFVVLDNRGFGSTRAFEAQYARELPGGAGTHPAGYIGSDFRSGPPVDAAARGFGIPATMLPDAGSLGPALAHRLERPQGPHVYVVPLPFELFFITDYGSALGTRDGTAGRYLLGLFELGAEVALANLAARVPRQHTDNAELGRHLVPAEAGAAESGQFLGHAFRRGSPLAHHHEGDRYLTPSGVGPANNGCLGDPGVLFEPDLDFPWIDVNPARDEQVGDPVGQEQVGPVVQIAHIAGVQPASRQRLGRVLRAVPVALHDVRTPDEYLAVLSRSRLGAVRARDPHANPHGLAPDGAQPWHQPIRTWYVVGRAEHGHVGRCLGKSVALLEFATERLHGGS